MREIADTLGLNYYTIRNMRRYSTWLPELVEYMKNNPEEIEQLSFSFLAEQETRK